MCCIQLLEITKQNKYNGVKFLNYLFCYYFAAELCTFFLMGAPFSSSFKLWLNLLFVIAFFSIVFIFLWYFALYFCLWCTVIYIVFMLVAIDDTIVPKLGEKPLSYINMDSNALIKLSCLGSGLVCDVSRVDCTRNMVIGTKQK